MRWLTVFSLWALCGCSDHMISKVQPRQAEILVHPAALDFDHLVSGLESDTLILNVINVGDYELHVDAPVLTDGDNRFSLGAEEGYTLQAGEIIDIPVTYIPETFETNEAVISITSSDEDEPYIEVPVIGNGDAPVISVDPLEYDYGIISIGCDNEERITIANEGNLPLIINSVIQMVTQPMDILLEYGALPEPPWTIDPGNELDFLVSYVPMDTGIDASSIEIVSNDPQTPSVTAIQDGVGDVEQWITDQYEQEEIPLLDVLWVIDNSGSMNAIQTSVATNMTDFMNVFLAASPDFHMGFITTDNAAFQGGSFIDNTSPDPATAASSIISGIGIYGSGMEKGIQFAKESTSSSAYAGPGSAFLRHDATLVIIFVSDEPDHSTGGWSAYTSHFSTLKPADKLHLVSIVPDDPGGCTWSNGSYTRYLSAGIGYTDITSYFGGDFYSICATDWGMQMEELADTVSVKRTFSLSEPDPIEETLEVYANGQLVAGTWEYNSTDNTVVFASGDEPDEGDTIDLVYATWGCD